MRSTKVATHMTEFLLCFRSCVGYSKYLMAPFISAVCQYFLNTHHIPSMVLGTENEAVTKTWPCPHRAYGLMEATGIYTVIGWGVHWEGQGTVGAGKGELAIYPGTQSVLCSTFQVRRRSSEGDPRR